MSELQTSKGKRNYQRGILVQLRIIKHSKLLPWVGHYQDQKNWKIYDYTLQLLSKQEFFSLLQFKQTKKKSRGESKCKEINQLCNQDQEIYKCTRMG